MRFRSLKQKVNITLLFLALVVFTIVALVSGLLEYNEIRAEHSKIMAAKIGMARLLVGETIFEYDEYVTTILNESADKEVGELLADLLDLLHFPNPHDTYYVIDSQGKVILIAEAYVEYWGLDFNALLPSKDIEQPLVSHYQSLLTDSPVVGIQYPLPEGMRLIIERDLKNIIPTMAHLEAGRLFAGELFFVLSASGRVVYHPDSFLTNSRHNLGFDIKKKTSPDADGRFTFVLRGVEYDAASEEFSVPPGWVIYYAVPRAEIVRAVQTAVINHIVLLLTTFAAVFVILQIFWHNFFTKPVSRIVEGLQHSAENKGLQLTAEMAAHTLEFQTIIEEINKRDEAVSQATERFQTVLDSLDAAVYVADMDTHELLFINSFGKKSWGDITGKVCWQSLQQGQSGPCQFCTNHLLIDDNGKPTGIYIWEFQNTKDRKWYECRDQAIRWTGGQLVRMEVATDITRRKEAEEELIAEKEQLAVTLRSIGDGVITTDVEGKVILANRVAEELIGWRQEEAIGRYLSEVFHIVDAKTEKPCADPVSLVLERGQIIALAESTKLISKDGTERIISDSGAPILDKKSQIIGIVLVFRDVTDENRLREEALKAKKLESVGVLAGGIAHDFNNILAAIMGNIDLASFRVGAKHESYPLLQMAKKASIRAKGLTQQLLTFAKGGDPVLETASLKEVIRDSANFILSGSNVSCSFNFAEGLWWASIDKGQISQVIQNIVINADQAMPAGGSIKIKCENVDLDGLKAIPLPKGKHVKISIADNGCGIHRESLTRIFDPYFSTKEIGQGLGLAVVRSIIEKHRGLITADSEVDKGTTFTMYLPATEAYQEYPPDMLEGTTSGKGKGVVLIMDDEEMVRNVVSQMLERLGFQTLQAVHGTAAIELYQKAMDTEQPVDLVIMDLTIPGGMGGKEAIRELLALDANARVIVSSGYANDPIMANCRDYGFIAAIQKPFQMSELTWVVEQHINHTSIEN